MKAVHEPLATSPKPAESGDLYVAVSIFEVANDKDQAVHDAFLARPHMVDSAAGFVRMEVLRDLDNPKEFWLLTYWTDGKSYEAWHRGHTYHASHEGIPKGLKLTKGSARVRRMRRISE